MTAQTVSSAVATRDRSDQLVTWIRKQQDDIAMAAASHVKPSAIIRVTQGALRRDPKLLAAAIANPQSLLYALLDCARLGHEPDTDDYYLVPFGQEVTGIEGYKGIIERMYRAGRVSSVVAEVVRQQDVYRRTGPTTPPVHEFDEFADPDDRGPLRGAYAYAVMLDGRFSKVIPMGRAEIMKHKAESRGSDRADSPWRKWEESMWKKCPLRGLEPYVPTSTEYRTVNHAAASVTPDSVTHAAAGFRYLPPPPASVPDSEIVEAEIVDDPPASNGAARQEPPKASPRTARRKTAAAGDDTQGQRPAGKQATRPQDAGDSTAQDATPRAAGAAPSRGAQPLPPLPGEDEPDGTGEAAADLAPGEAAEFGTERHRKVAGIVWQHLGRLGYPAKAKETDEEKRDRLADVARLAGVAEIGSTGDLDLGELSLVADTLARCKDRAALDALLRAGEVDD